MIFWSSYATIESINSDTPSHFVAIVWHFATVYVLLRVDLDLGGVDQRVALESPKLRLGRAPLMLPAPVCGA